MTTLHAAAVIVWIAAVCLLLMLLAPKGTQP